MKLVPVIIGIAGVIAMPLACAQSWPVKPVRVIIPWPPGGSNDIVGRVLVQRLSENLGQQFVIDNRAGASSMIGVEMAAKSPPDGYTMLINSATQVANPVFFKKAPYDAFRDFAAVTPLARQVGILVVHPSVPAKTVKDFIALAKARSGQVVYASSGSGSFTHLTMALFNEMTQTKMLHVPYKGGGPAVMATVAGEAHTFFTGIAAVLPSMKTGRLRGLGVSSADRVTQVPDIPTMAEAGVPGYELTAWVGAFVPAATPRPIVERLNAEIKKALEHPEVSRNLSSQTLDSMYTTPEQFTQRMRADHEKYERLARVAEIKME